MIFISSDTHWFHKNIIRYTGRPFDSVQEMNETMIKRWNSKVKPDDLVIHLGDFALTDLNKLRWLKEQLNGQIFLILGNHDKAYFFKKLRVPVLQYYIFGSNILSHYPLSLVPEGYVNIHGHIHDRDTWGNRINLSVEQTNYEPVELTSLTFNFSFYNHQ